MPCQKGNLVVDDPLEGHRVDLGEDAEVIARVMPYLRTRLERGLRGGVRRCPRSKSAICTSFGASIRSTYLSAR